jgi:hypothetical protein
MNKIILIGAIAILAIAAVLIIGQSPKNSQSQETLGKLGEIKTPLSGKCAPGPVDLPNYGEKGRRQSNCFIQYPGEPTRQDTHYFIVEDICGQFTQEFIENILGRKLAKIVPSPYPGLYNCSYYFDDKEYIMLVLDYLSIANQKSGQEYLGRKIMVDDKIPMENFYVVQENGLINTAYLVLDPSKFISIERSSSKALAEAEVLQFMEKLGGEIKDYK